MPEPISIGLGAATALGSLLGSEQSGESLDFLKQQYGDRLPLRAMGLSRVQAPLPERPDLRDDFADPSNPFYKRPSAIGFGGGYSNQPPDLGAALADQESTAADARSSALRQAESTPAVEWLRKNRPDWARKMYGPPPNAPGPANRAEAVQRLRQERPGLSRHASAIFPDFMGV